MTMSLGRSAFLRLGAAAAAGLATPARAQQIPPRSNTPVTISFYNYNLATAGLGAQATRDLIRGFMQANPHIRVEGVGVTSTQILARTQADVAAGRPPDVAQLIFSDLDFIATSLGVKPLQDIIPADEWAEHTAGMVPNGLRLGAIQGRVYGIPYVFSTPVLFYNANLFRDAGLNPDQPPRNWDEVKRAALAIRDRTRRNGVFPGIYSSFDWLAQSLVLSNGGRVLSPDRRRLMFGEPEPVEALNIMRDLMTSGAHARLGEAEAMDAFGSGNLGMVLTTSARQHAFLSASRNRFELRAAAMPAFGDKPTRPTNSGSALFIMARDPLKQRAAWELMKHLTSREAYTVITSRIGYLPLRLDIVDDPNHLQDWVRENPLVLPNLEQLTRLEPWEAYPGPNYLQISRIFVAAVNEAVYGNADIATVMRDAQVRAQALMP
jgi:multiple sugar transport system substrate-binding protein